MQGFMILGIIGIEKDTLVFYSTQIVDERAIGRTYVYILLSILHVKKVSNNTKRTQQYSRLLRIKSYFQRL